MLLTLLSNQGTQQAGFGVYLIQRNSVIIGGGIQ